MKAVICTRYGPPEVLIIVETNKPTIKDNQVLVKVYATNVTSGDVRIRAFNVPISFWIPGRLFLGITKPRNQILGSVFAGKIEQVGKDVKNFKINDRVFGFKELEGGTYAEYISIDEDKAITTIPENYSYIDASAILWGGGTSFYFLKKANITKDQKILIYGASGSLGTSAIQIAKYYGANVTAVCSTDNIELVKALGADRVIDYKVSKFYEEEIKYDVIFDTVGKCPIYDSVSSLSANGTFINAVGTPGINIKIKMALIGTQKIYVSGTFTAYKELVNNIKDHAQKNVLKPVVDKIFTLDEIVEAHRYVDLGHKKGNVVVTVD